MSHGVQSFFAVQCILLCEAQRSCVCFGLAGIVTQYVHNSGVHRGRVK